MQDRQARSLRDLRGDSNFFSCAREPERRWFLEAKKKQLDAQATCFRSLREIFKFFLRSS